MKAVVQRVKSAGVKIDGEVVGRIGAGVLVLLGVGRGDSVGDAEYLARKITGLRIFNDESGRMNLSLGDVGGAMLVVSQFTLYGDARRGKRPSYVDAAPQELAEPLYEKFVELVRERGIPTQTGRFGAGMEVELVNWGPVTFIIESGDRV